MSAEEAFGGGLDPELVREWEKIPVEPKSVSPPDLVPEEDPYDHGDDSFPPPLEPVEPPRPFSLPNLNPITALRGYGFVRRR